MVRMVRIDKLNSRFAFDAVTQIHIHDDISIGGKNDRHPTLWFH